MQNYKLQIENSLFFPFMHQEVHATLIVSYTDGREIKWGGCRVIKDASHHYRLLRKSLFGRQDTILTLEDNQKLQAIEKVTVCWEIKGVQCEDTQEKNIYLYCQYDLLYQIDENKKHYLLKHTEEAVTTMNEKEILGNKDKAILFLKLPGEEIEWNYLKGESEDKWEESYDLEKIMGHPYEASEAFSIYYYQKDLVLEPSVRGEQQGEKGEWKIK